MCGHGQLAPSPADWSASPPAAPDLLFPPAQSFYIFPAPEGPWSFCTVPSPEGPWSFCIFPAPEGPLKLLHLSSPGGAMGG